MDRNRTDYFREKREEYRSSHVGRYLPRPGSRFIYIFIHLFWNPFQVIQIYYLSLAAHSLELDCTKRNILFSFSFSSESFSTEDALLQGSSHDDHVAVLMSNPPKWMPIIDDIKRDTANIEAKMKELDELHKSHLLVGFGDDEREEHKIQILTAEITRKFQDNNKKLKLLAPPKSQTMKKEDVMKKNIRATLASQLNQLSFEFRRKQKGQR